MGEADVGFAEAMIRYNGQAADMSELVLERTRLDPAVRSLARQVLDTQLVETEQLQDWLMRPGRPSAGDASSLRPGGGEDGIASADQMRALNGAKDAAAQSLYLQMMLKHHRGAVAAARAEVERGTDPVMIHFAHQLRQTCEAELTTMQQAAAAGQPTALPGLTPPSGNATPRS